MATECEFCRHKIPDAAIVCSGCGAELRKIRRGGSLVWESTSAHRRRIFDRMLAAVILVLLTIGFARALPDHQPQPAPGTCVASAAQVCP